MNKSLMVKIISVLNVILLLAIFIVSIPIFQSFAYRTNGFILNTDYILTFVPHQDFGATTISHFNEALWNWNSTVGMSLMSREPTLRHNTTGYPQDDNKHYIYREAKSLINDVAQITIYRSAWPNEHVIKSADILINMKYSFSNGNQSNTYDTWSVFIHEAGHAAGLDHTQLSNNNIVMYDSIAYDQLRRSLHQDDINGVKSIYN